MATAVGVLFGAAQLLLSRSQSRTAFEDGLSSQYRQMIKPGLSDALLRDLGPEDRELIARFYEYLDLCNEQVFLRMQGRVCRRTWQEWREGIQSNLGRGAIKDAWSTAHESLSDFDELRLLHDSGYSSDPRGWNPMWRRASRRELSAGELRRRVLGPDQISDRPV